MSTTTRMSFEEFLRLPEEPGKHYELSEGELIVEPSPAFWHNSIRNRVARRLQDFVQSHALGAVTVENDFRLAPNIVRNPDVAFIATARLKHIDIDVSPIEGAPTLAVEVVSPSNSAQDMLLKEHQYLSAGCEAVWVVYPTLGLVTVRNSTGMREVRNLLPEAQPFMGNIFSMILAEILDRDITK